MVFAHCCMAAAEGKTYAPVLAFLEIAFLFLDVDDDPRFIVGNVGKDRFITRIGEVKASSVVLW